MLESKEARRLFIGRLQDEGYLAVTYHWLIDNATTIADWIDDCLWFELADGIQYVKNGVINLNFQEDGINVAVEEEIGESEIVRLIEWKELDLYELTKLRRKCQ